MNDPYRPPAEEPTPPVKDRPQGVLEQYPGTILLLVGSFIAIRIALLYGFGW